MTHELIPFDARLVSDATESPDGLYVRTTDDVLHVTPAGQVSRVHSLKDQSPFGFKGLVLEQDTLWTFDQPLSGSPTLTAIRLGDGGVRQYAGAFRRPEALLRVSGQLLVLDQLVPVTDISLWQDDRKQLLAQARNLTHWLVRDDAFLWSEDQGIWQWSAGHVTRLVDHPDILTFDESLNFVTWSPDDAGHGMEVHVPGHALPVPSGRPPVALLTLAAGPFIRFDRELAPLQAPHERQPLTERDELGPVLNPGDRVVFLGDARDLASSTDGQTWTHEELPVKCTRLVQAGPHVVGSSRQGAVWIRHRT